MLSNIVKTQTDAFSRFKSCALTFTLAASLAAQTTTAPAPKSAPWDDVDAAKAEQAKDPLGADGLRYATANKLQLGLSPDDSFAVVNANRDDLGNVHVRMQQYYKGVKVLHGQVISHTNSRGEYSQFTNSLKRGIGISAVPALSKQAAIDHLRRKTGPGGPNSATPKVDLVILPVMERYLVATGMPVPDPIQVNEPGKKNPEHAEESVDPINAAATARRVKEYRLVYEIVTAEGDPRSGGEFNGHKSHVDANTGEVIKSSPVGDLDGVPALAYGKGFWNNPAVIATELDSGGFRLHDMYRKFRTRDYDNQSGYWDALINYSPTNEWGDGNAFEGTQNPANRQTQMVDAHFGATVYWDMLSNVFGRKGPDGKFKEVDIFAHYGTNWASSMYWNGNIYLGDPKYFTAIGTVGHENAHALVDHTSQLSNDSGEAWGLNESTGDIFGALATFYLNGGGQNGAKDGNYAKSLKTIPDDGGSWTIANFRNMKNPSLSTPSIPNYWSYSIGASDGHISVGPNDRMFYFLSKGSSAYLNVVDNSPLLPWGMQGIGNQKAAQIYYDAVTSYMTDDADYNQARDACFLATILRFGLGKELDAVFNAYAAVNVGSPAPSYPAVPAITYEGSTSKANPQKIANPMNAQPTTPSKVHIRGAGTGDDYYQVDLDIAQTLTMRLEAGRFNDYDLYLYDVNDKDTPIASSLLSAPFADTIKFTYQAIKPGKHSFVIKVHYFTSPFVTAGYDLFLDLPAN